MGVRSDLAIAFTKKGWEKLQTHIQQNCCLGGQDTIAELINDADKKLIHSSGARLIYWECIKTYTDDVLELKREMNTSLDQEDFYSVELVEDGSEEFDGAYYDSPFGICTSHSLFMNEDDCEDAPDGYDGVYTKVGYTAAPTVLVNDHYCGSCGNDKCNSSEKSCWKCGAKL